MVDSNTKQLIIDTINQMTDSNQTFTAYTITEIIRDKLAVRFPHHELREVVHEYYELGCMSSNYIREAFDIGVGKTPFVYYPDDTYPTDFINKLLSKNTQYTISTNIPAVGNLTYKHKSNKVPTPNNTLYLTTNKCERDITPDCRLTIPSKFVKELGLRYGSLVGVNKSGNGIIVTEYLCNGTKHSSILSVNSKGNIRLNLKKFNVPTNRVTIEVDVHTSTIHIG